LFSAAETGIIVPIRVADLPGRRSLRYVGTNRLVVPPVRLSTVGSRAFPVVGPHVWNDLPEDVTPAVSLSTFRRQLKTHLFIKSFPDCLLDIKEPLTSGPSGSFYYFGHFKNFLLMY